MASPRKIYKRTGLRRDKNFADLSDSKQALNNILDTLVDTADSTFISEDLDPIRTIFTTGITAGEYQQFIGSLTKESDINGSINAIEPAVTYQNRLDKFRVTSGEPRINGGNGLTAKYFNQDQVEDTPGVFTGITTGGAIPSDTFWEAGQFNYTRKIHPQSVSAAGGVQWEGFFIPTQTGAYNFNINSTLGFTADFETQTYSEPTGSVIAGEFLTPTNVNTLNGDITISRTSGQTGVLTLANITDGTSVNYTFSDSFTTIPTSAFTAGKQYQISVNTNMDLKFVMNGAGGGTGGGSGGKLDATINIKSSINYTLIVGVVGQVDELFSGLTQVERLIRGAGGGSSGAGGFSGGGFTGLFETTTILQNSLFSNAILISGGGGGAGGNAAGGGAGGGLNGSNGNGQGGTQTAGGQGSQLGNYSGFNGSQLFGGRGSGGDVSGAGGGAGGGGYYGGGGGRGDTNTSPGGQPGGGGSGFIDQTKGAAETGSGTYTEYSRVGLTTTITGTTSGTNIVTVPTANTVNIGIGMSVTGSGILSESKVSSIDRSTGNITLTNPDGDPITSVVSNQSYSFTRELGTSVNSNFSTQILENGEKYRIRFRFFAPPDTTNLAGIIRSITFSFSGPSQSIAPLRYNNLYSLDYDFSAEAKGDINKFLEQSVLSGGNKEDGTESIGGLTLSGYVRVSTNKKVDIRYVPKESLSKIERKQISGSWSTNTSIITLGDTTNIEVGNYVFGTGLTSNIDTPVRVTEIRTNSLILIDTPTTSAGSGVSLTFVDHRGFVKRVTASSNSAGLVTISNGDTVGLKSKQIAIWDSSEKYTGITTTGSSNQFNIISSQVFDSRGPNSNNFTLASNAPSNAIAGVEWGSFLRTYGVWHDPGNIQTLGQTYSTTYTLDIKTPGNYTLEYSGDDVGSITFDGTTVGTIPQATPSYKLFATSDTTTISNVTAGAHSLVVNISNTSLGASYDNWNQNPAGVGWTLTRILPNPLTFTSKTVYFYESRGLIDTALAAFCPTTDTGCVLVTNAATSPSTQLVVADSSNLLNRKIQGFPFADNTIINGLTGNNQISLNKPTIKNIAADSRFTTTTANEDKTLCCPPTDTSPPFNPTEEGLETILGGADNLKITGGNLIFDNLTATVSSSNITALTGTNNSSKRIELKGGDGVVYNLLCE
jgi:hypothetical protein